LIAANFTLIAIVTSLSQFVLGRRLESPGEIRDALEDTVTYRQAIADDVGEGVLPVAPDAFFAFLFARVGDTVDRLARAANEGPERWTTEEIDDLTAGLRANVDAVAALLDRPESGMRHALFAALNTEYEVYVHRAWYLQAEYGDDLADRVAEPLDRLTDVVEHTVVATRMFKTTFIESEVAELSRFLLYVGLPAQIAAVVVILLYTEPGTAPPLARPLLAVVVPGVVTAGFAPFLVLAAYVIRLTVVARRTANQFPFSSRLDGAVGPRARTGRRDRDGDWPRGDRSTDD
jgi:hypothetical protein